MRAAKPRARKYSLLLLFQGIVLLTATAQRPAHVQGQAPIRRADWNKYLPAIAKLVQHNHPAELAEDPHGIFPKIAAETTFSGIPTALVDLSCCGAYTDLIDIVQIRNGHAVYAVIWAPKDVSVHDFLQGASTVHVVQTNFDPKRNAVVVTASEANTSWTEDEPYDQQTANCQQDTFVWNAARSRFEWSRQFSFRRTAPNCSEFNPLTR